MSAWRCWATREHWHRQRDHARGGPDAERHERRESAGRRSTSSWRVAPSRGGVGVCSSAEEQRRLRVDCGGILPGKLHDRSAIGPLIDALRTTHKFIENPDAQPGQMTTTFGRGASAGSGGLSVGGGPKAVKMTLENQEVLAASWPRSTTRPTSNSTSKPGALVGRYSANRWSSTPAAISCWVDRLPSACPRGKKKGTFYFSLKSTNVPFSVHPAAVPSAGSGGLSGRQGKGKAKGTQMFLHQGKKRGERKGTFYFSYKVKCPLFRSEQCLVDVSGDFRRDHGRGSRSDRRAGVLENPAADTLRRSTGGARNRVFSARIGSGSL